MFTIYRHEIHENVKNFIIWSFSVGILGLICMAMYSGMSEDMAALADSFSNMGAFSEAFGMSTLGIGTPIGYFATEIGTIHGLGGGLFAAILATGILSKEEESHTGEFLYSLPVSRVKIVTSKLMAVESLLVGFSIVCGLLYMVGFVYLGEDIPMADFAKFIGLELLLDTEIAMVCFLISAFGKKTKLGTGLGITLVFYAYDLIGRVVPDMKDYLFIGPYSYANASEIFSGKDIEIKAVAMACTVIAVTAVLAYVTYSKKDLAS